MAGPDNEWVEPNSDYQAFLLRCWREAESDDHCEVGRPDQWRFSIVRSATQQDSVAFSCLEDLVTYLADKLQTTAGGE
ncbi:MAG: hypothetical protein PVH65_15175 [Chloroflexota bacterium]|jgi:hypothetical protein